MKKASIICLDLKPCSLAQKTAIQRALKGYKDYSNKGTHIYERRGKLDEIPHSKLNKGVIVLESKDKNKITSILKKHGASYNVFDIMAPKTLLH